MAEPLEGGVVREEYDRGHAAGMVAGDIAARLARHDDHFVRINGSVSELAKEMSELRRAFSSEVHGLTMAVQRLTDENADNARNVVTAAAALRDQVQTTATALEKADAARRTQTESRWSPLQRLGTAVAIVAAVVLIIGGVVALVARG
jgi:hypothetical protein